MNGSIASASGVTEGSSARIRLAAPVPVDSSWKVLQFSSTADVEVTVFAYGVNGDYLTATGFQSLAEPYDYAIPAGTVSINYVISYSPDSAGKAISPTGQNPWVTITAVDPPTSTTASQFCTVQQGSISLTDGSYGSATDTSEIRLDTPAAVNPAWTRLRFAGESDTSIAVFAYDDNGTFLSGSGWQSLASPYTWNLPSGTAEISYAVQYDSGAPIAPDGHRPWVTISDAPLPSDPAFSDFEQGLINEGDSALSTYNPESIDLATPAFVDPAWKALEFTGTENGDFSHTLILEVFAYDADGNFLGQDSGPQILDGTPFVYEIPAGTVSINYEISYLNSDDITPADQSTWVTLSVTTPPPASDYFQLHTQSIAPEFTIPGINDSQAVNWVNGDLWTSDASSDNPVGGGTPAPANGKMYIYSVNWATHQASLIHEFSDNFGHMNSWGWSPINNDIIAGNGGTNFELPPAFSVIPVANLNLDGTNTLASTGAITYSVPADFGTRPELTWTSTPNVAIMATDYSTTIREIRLDTGTDQGQYGNLPGRRGRRLQRHVRHPRHLPHLRHPRKQRVQRRADRLGRRQAHHPHRRRPGDGPRRDHAREERAPQLPDVLRPQPGSGLPGLLLRLPRRLHGRPHRHGRRQRRNPVRLRLAHQQLDLDPRGPTGAARPLTLAARNTTEAAARQGRGLRDAKLKRPVGRGRPRPQHGPGRCPQHHRPGI